jgi:hypothetical protein
MIPDDDFDEFDSDLPGNFSSSDDIFSQLDDIDPEFIGKEKFSDDADRWKEKDLDDDTDDDIDLDEIEDDD